MKKRIHRVTAPTRVVWGTNDRIAPPVYADEFVRRIRGARGQTVDGCGHAPQEPPAPVAGMVREFLHS
jgi:pimeloyl-ACP methyl ester carboxylesterase